MNHEINRERQGDWRAVLARYLIAHEERCVAVKELGRRWNQLSYVRGGLFFAAIAAFTAGIQVWGGVSVVWWIAAGILVTTFLIVVGWHDMLERALDAGQQAAAFYADSIARCRRDWQRMPISEVSPSPQFRCISQDLDVFGRASLAQLFGTVRTAVGLPILSNWLMTPANPGEIEARQQSVFALSKNTNLRERFQTDCQIAAASPIGSERFLAWVASSSWWARHPILLWYSRFAAVLTIGFIAGFFGGWLSPQFAGTATLIMLAMNFITTVFTSGKVHETFEHVSSRKNEIRHYVELFGQLSQLESHAPRLVELRTTVTRGADSALHGMASLARIVWLGNLRRHGILFIAYLFLQFVVLWDLHQFYRLERWQARFRHHVSEWFTALGQAEVLAAMATLAYEHPAWVFPRIECAEPRCISAQQMGHPLLPNDGRVCNDVEVGPPGTVLIVTGSNMSGKSTMLRALGLNNILAQMGSVVCAQGLVIPPLVLETSMRIDDSLSDGVSFFMAELKRLKQIVDCARAVHSGGGQLLFLLDEILQGTNSRERHIAVGAVIAQLLDCGAIGSFTTHDLDLARDASLVERSRSVYFVESFEKTASGDVMTFDYVMRPGIAPSTNALKLLRIVGLAPNDP